jgi:hypothetical protein
MTVPYAAWPNPLSYIILRAILNFIPGPHGRTSPPRGELCPLGGMFTPSSKPYLFRRMEGRTEIFTPQGIPFTPKGQN